MTDSPKHRRRFLREEFPLPSGGGLAAVANGDDEAPFADSEHPKVLPLTRAANQAQEDDPLGSKTLSSRRSASPRVGGRASPREALLHQCSFSSKHGFQTGPGPGRPCLSLPPPHLLSSPGVIDAAPLDAPQRNGSVMPSPSSGVSGLFESMDSAPGQAVDDGPPKLERDGDDDRKHGDETLLESESFFASTRAIYIRETFGSTPEKVKEVCDSKHLSLAKIDLLRFQGSPSVYQRLYSAGQRTAQKIELARKQHALDLEEEAKTLFRPVSFTSTRSQPKSSNDKDENGDHGSARGSRSEARLYYQAIDCIKSREEKAKRFAEALKDAELTLRESEFEKGKLVRPFQPDISGLARQVKREEDLMSRLDALGHKKKKSEDQRQKLRSQPLSDCTFQPNISKAQVKGSNVNEAARRHDLHQSLYEDRRNRVLHRESPSQVGLSQEVPLHTKKLNSSQLQVPVFPRFYGARQG